MNSSQQPSPQGGGVQGGKDTKSPAAEDLFMEVFSLGDTPTTEEVKAIAAKAGCDEDQVRTFFSKLRSSVRSFVQRAQRKSDLSSTGAGSSHTPKHATQQNGERQGEAGAGPAAGPPSPLAVIDRAGALRETGLRKLRLLLDESGGLRDSTVTGSFSQLMRKAEAATLRCDVLRALLATQRSAARSKLLQHAGFLPTLEDWAREGEDDHQATLLRLLLQVLGELPLTAALVKSSPGLVKAVGRLQKDRHPQVAAAAKQLSERWQAMTAAPAEASPTGPAAAAAPVARRVPGQVAAPSAAGTAAGTQQQPVQGGAAAAPAVVPTAARGGNGGLAALRKPAAGEQLIQLGRKALFGKRPATTAAPLVRAGSSADAEAVASPRAAAGAVAPGQPSALRRLTSDGGSEGGGNTPRGAAPLRTLGSGGLLRTSRPMSVDDIRKARERQRASEALQSLVGGPGSGRPAAKRPRPDASAEPPRTAPPPPALRQQQQQPQPHASQPPQQPQALQLPQQLGPAPHMSPPAAVPAAFPGAAAGAIPGYAPVPSSGFGGMPPSEPAIAVQQYEQDKQRRAAARRAALLQEYVAMDEAASRRGAMQPALPTYPPPPPLQLPQLDLPVALGEESSEVVGQQARIALVAPAVYHTRAGIPATPEEPRSQAEDPTWQVPQVPFVPIDPEEAIAQRERLLRDGVRLPQYLDLP